MKPRHGLYHSVMLDGSPAPATMNSNRRVVRSSISTVAEGWLGAEDVDIDEVTAAVLRPSEEPVTAAEDGTAVNEVDPTRVALAELEVAGETDGDPYSI